MEQLKETIFKQYLKSNDKLKKLYTKYNSIDTTEKIIEEQETLKAIKKEQEKEKLKNNILYNNLIFLILEETKKDIFNIMDKYEEKRQSIGEKTREKIASEIKELFQNISIFKKTPEIYVYITYYSLNNYTIGIETREQKNGVYLYDFHIKIERSKVYNCYNNEYNDRIDFYTVAGLSSYNYQYFTNYQYIKLNDINKLVNKIISESEKEQKYFEKVKEELKTRINNHNEFISQFALDTYLQDQYYLNYSFKLY